MQRDECRLGSHRLAGLDRCPRTNPPRLFFRAKQLVGPAVHVQEESTHARQRVAHEVKGRQSKSPRTRTAANASRETKRLHALGILTHQRASFGMDLSYFREDLQSSSRGWIADEPSESRECWVAG